MTEEQKAKLAYSEYQDNSAWSRSNYLLAVQGATLAGIYTIRTIPTAPWCLATLSAIVTILIWLIVERDQFVRDKAFDESGVAKTNTANPPWYARLKGKYAYRIIFGILIAADFLAVWLLRQ